MAYALDADWQFIRVRGDASRHLALVEPCALYRRPGLLASSEHV